MPQLLLLNPTTRAKGHSMKKHHRSAAQRRATAKLVAMNRARKHRRNPVAKVTRRRARRANPIMASTHRRVVRHHRRRRNPIRMSGIAGGMMGMFKGALVQASGAVVMDAAFGQVKGFLPASMQRVPGSIGIGDAVKAVFTAMVGKLLSKPTRGLSMKAAQGSLTVQAYSMLSTLVPASLPLGYSSPALTAQGQNRITPNGVGRFTAPGVSPLLGRFTQPGISPLLPTGGSRDSTMSREGVTMR